MNTLHKDTLVADFISDTDTIAEIWMNNFQTIEYYYKRHSSSSKWEDMIKEIIENSFYYELEWENIQDIINNIENYYETEYVDWLVDLYDNKLIQSLDYFGINYEIQEWETDISRVIMRIQFENYLALFEDIRTEFIKYLEWLDY